MSSARWQRRLSGIATVLLALAGSAAVGMPWGAIAQSYPSKPIQFIQGFGAGGNGDVVARLLAAKLSEGMGQQVLVEGKTGAGGNIASAYVAKAPADGYTLILLTGGHAVSGALYSKLSFDPVDDFSMISTVTFFPFMLGTNPDLPIRSVADLIAYAKSNPGKLNFGSAGVGSTQHLAGELFKTMAGIDVNHVPYRGGATVVQEVMAGRLDYLFETMTPTLPQVKAGRLRAIGVTSTAPAAALPEVPPIAQTVANFDVTSWMGVAAPPKMPRPILDRLNAEMRKVVASPDIRERLAALGGEPRASSSEEMRAHVAAEVAKWKRVVEVAKIEKQ